MHPRSRGPAGVAVVETADARERDDAAVARRFDLAA
jgi:hypothetical protein